MLWIVIILLLFCLQLSTIRCPDTVSSSCVIGEVRPEGIPHRLCGTLHCLQPPWSEGVVCLCLYGCEGKYMIDLYSNGVLPTHTVHTRLQNQSNLNQLIFISCTVTRLPKVTKAKAKDRWTTRLLTQPFWCYNSFPKCLSACHFRGPWWFTSYRPAVATIDLMDKHLVPIIDRFS